MTLADPEIPLEPAPVDPELAELKETARQTFEQTELQRLSGLCGYTDAAYDALLDEVAANLLAAGYRKATEEQLAR